MTDMPKKLVKIVRERGKIGVYSHNCSTKKQLSYFNTPETPIKQGIYASGTIEWE